MNVQPITCPTCGLTYVDDADWSGPAHPERECVASLGAEVTRLRGWLAKAAEMFHAAGCEIEARIIEDVMPVRRTTAATPDKSTGTP